MQLQKGMSPYVLFVLDIKGKKFVLQFPRGMEWVGIEYRVYIVADGPTNISAYSEVCIRKT